MDRGNKHCKSDKQPQNKDDASAVDIVDGECPC